MKRKFTNEECNRALKLINYNGPREERNFNAVDILLTSSNIENSKYKRIIMEFLTTDKSYEEIGYTYQRSGGRIREILKEVLRRMTWDSSMLFITEGFEEGDFVKDYRFYRMCELLSIEVKISKEDRRNIKLAILNIPFSFLDIPGRLPIRTIGQLEDWIEDKGASWHTYVTGLHPYVADYIENTIKKIKYDE